MYDLKKARAIFQLSNESPEVKKAKSRGAELDNEKIGFNFSKI